MSKAPLKIVFQGEPGANSDIACREAYPDAVPTPCPAYQFSMTADTWFSQGMVTAEPVFSTTTVFGFAAATCWIRLF